MNDWKSLSEQTPPDGLIVDTKIDDSNGVRNQQYLKKKGYLWWLPDDSMYVYYTPTHWRVITKVMHK